MYMVAWPYSDGPSTHILFVLSYPIPTPHDATGLAMTLRCKRASTVVVCRTNNPDPSVIGLYLHEDGYCNLSQLIDGVRHSIQRVQSHVPSARRYD